MNHDLSISDVEVVAWSPDRGFGPTVPDATSLICSARALDGPLVPSPAVLVPAAPPSVCPRAGLLRTGTPEPPWTARRLTDDASSTVRAPAPRRCAHGAMDDRCRAGVTRISAGRSDRPVGRRRRDHAHRDQPHR